jgi:hypothetical protein
MQSRRMSLVEAMSNTVIAFVISSLLQQEVFSRYGIEVPIREAALVVSMFTAISVVRGFIIRRGFNGIEHTKNRRVKSWIRAIG